MEHYSESSGSAAEATALDKTTQLQALVDEALASGVCTQDMQAIRQEARERLKREL